MTEDTVIPNVWSEMHPGLRIRFITPSFVRRGTLLKIKNRSMTIQFDGLPKPTVIPDARQYFVDHLGGREDWGLCAIEGQPIDATPADDGSSEELIDGSLISVALAANILGTDSKTIRRKLRSGQIEGKQIDGRWAVDPDSLRKS